MKWLVTLFREGLSWVFRNPILILVVLLATGYSHFVPDGLPKLENIDMTHPSSLLNALLSAGHFIFTPSGLIFWAATSIGAALTMFSTGAMLAVFARNGHPFIAGIQRMLSVGTIQFLALEVIIGFASAFLALGVIGSVVYLLPQSGIWGVLIIVIAAALSYPIAYMSLTIGAVIIGTTASSREKMYFAQTLLSGKNVRRLCSFYLVRMGAEMVVVYIALMSAQYLEVPPVLTGIIVVLILTVPLTLLRTTALVMKLEMLRTTPWFQQQFKTYYASRLK